MSNQWNFSTEASRPCRSWCPWPASAGRHWRPCHQQLFDTVKRVSFDDAQLVVQVEAEALELIVNDLLGTLVAK
jgi:hypothetical protein